MYFHCQTNLIATFKEMYPMQFRYEGNRSMIFDVNDKIAIKPLRDCVSLALTYRLTKPA